MQQQLPLGWAVEDPPRSLVGQFPVGDDRLAVNDYVPETDGVLVRLIELGLIGYRVGIEDHDVGFHAGAQQSAIE